ncbi:hypothetical protein CR51_02155 [Caballeronia megalochromosomata]|nr:hypothetical protein CR51_02155 [Caballeronia megalochromosomata]
MEAEFANFKLERQLFLCACGAALNFSQTAAVVQQHVQVVSKSLLYLIRSQGERLRSDLIYCRGFPWQQWLAVLGCEGAVSLRQYTGWWHRCQQSASFFSFEHGGANAEPTTKLNCPL